MSQTENPLDQLRDIHLPEGLNGLEIAPIWWILAGLFIIGLIYLILLMIKRKKSLYLLNPAKQELKLIAALAPDNKAVAQLSALLKRICLIYYPKNQIASLSGNQWLDFLNQQTQQTLFDEQLSQLFSQVAYQANQSFAPELWQQLINQSEIAIEYIIRKAAKEQRR